MDATEDLTPLDPAFVTELRFSGIMLSLILLGPVLTLETIPGLPTGVGFAPAALLTAWLVLVVPGRRYRRWGYQLAADRLRIVRGFLFHRDTVVPLGRVQHIDVHQGPVMRRLGLARLTVHTAGTINASVSLPGLKHADALAMREAIRAQIKAGQA